MYNDTITLFNRYESRLGDVWYPTILHNVNLNMDKAAIMAKYGMESQDNAVLNVRYKQNGANKMVDGKLWLPPKEWDKQTNDMLPLTLTFSSGSAFDFFWLGEWGGSSQINDGDYTADAGFYGYMNRLHDYVFAITSVGGPYSVIPHFEIMGR